MNKRAINTSRGLSISFLTIRAGIILAAAFFSTYVHAEYGQYRRPPAQVFVGYTGTAGDPGELSILRDFLDDLSREAPNTLNLDDAVPLNGWSALDAVSLVSSKEQEAKVNKGYPVVYDHYLIAKMSKKKQRYCGGDDVYMTEVTFEVGRFTGSGGDRRVFFFSYPSDKLFVQIGHPNYQLKGCFGAASAMTEQPNEQWLGRTIQDSVNQFTQGLIGIFPNLRKADEKNKFLFYLSCLDVNNQKGEKNHEWTVDDILMSRKPLSEQKGVFFARLAMDLINHPDDRGFLVPWAFDKLDVLGENLESLERLCSEQTIPIDDPQDEDVFLRATLTDGDAAQKVAEASQMSGVTLQIYATDVAWRKSLENAKPPREVKYDSYQEMIDAVRHEATDYTLVSCSAPALWAIAESDAVIDSVAIAIRKLVDQQQHHPTTQGLGAACEPKKD